LWREHMNRIDLGGRRAVITGGAQGIGQAVAERLMESGASVSLWDRNMALTETSVTELSARGAVHGLAVDVTDAEGIANAAVKTVTELGTIDILVNSAGITGPNTQCWNYPVNAWRQVIEVNLTGTFLCLPGCGAAYDSAKIRPNREYFLGRGERGESKCFCV
jgi:NAD(P)-dependent dehydrogenase (short-subunit alcohol dehydrogenase family)